ncbi:hypothetical protein [Chlorogloea sp. CCALA 695]|uniref:hypothetical protein n=1 Tax=Chlorogloea sp. CCALA 695 TaxID=2107693 RepID=UPI000D066331|nr:hypothetical protein [Chlorogloea sp. CCALA 695]PSB34614.1 hypothetical protein C7B70_03940 [Chlorogloea sp. CCALA 695]
MIFIDLTLKSTAFPVSVQRKTSEDAEAVYTEIVAAMRSGQPEIMELTCDRQTEKKVAVRVSEILSIQIAQKDGSAVGGNRPPGFFALGEAT